MTTILFIQGIHNFSLKERFIRDVSEATGIEVVHFPMDYGLLETGKHLELIRKIEDHIASHDGRFIILAHSFGGVLAYCLSDQSYEKVDKILTFASPHQVPFAWFRSLTGKLPYRREVPVPVQESCGFYLDSTVPFVFTQLSKAHPHRNYLGTHTRVKDRKAFFRKLVLEGVR